MSRALQRSEREAAFWDSHLPSVEELIADYEVGPDRNVTLLLDSVEPLAGRRVLDFACGAGVLSGWLSDRGARVTGLDISPGSIARANAFARAIGADVSFITGDATVLRAEEPFDVIVGRYALHHVDCGAVAPILAGCLRRGGRGAFLETMDVPILRLARSHFVGRFGIPRYGTTDERPLGARELEILRSAFGIVKSGVAEMRFLRIFDRQVLRYRSRHASKLLGAFDDFLLKHTRLGRWSYHQVLVFGADSTATGANERPGK